MSASSAASSSVGRSGGFFLVGSSGGEVAGSSTGGGSIIELLSGSSASQGSFGVSSTVKGAGSAALGGRVDLLVSFGGFVAATFTDSNRLVIYSLQNQAKHNQSTLPERARSMLVDPFSRFLVIGSQSGRLRLYSLATGALVADVKTHHDRGLNALAMDRSARFLVAGGEDGIISVYDFGALVTAVAPGTSAASRAQAALVLSISDHSLAITSLHVSASALLLSASKDGSVRLYSLEQPVHALTEAGVSSSAAGAPSPPCLFHHAFRGIVHSAVLDATESIIYAACKESVHWLAVYGAARPSVAATWRGHSSTVMSLALSSAGQLASLDAEGLVKLWEAPRAYSSTPPQQATCLKTLARRSNCRQILFVEPQRSGLTAGAVATRNTHAAQHAPPARGAGLQSKESGWIFPPLNSSVIASGPGTPAAASGLIYLPVALVQHAPVNGELRGALVRSAGALGVQASPPRKRRWADAALDEVESSSASASAHALRAMESGLVTGSAGWSGLAESASARGASMDRLQDEADTNAQYASELYHLCVDKLWKEIKQ